MVASCKVYLSDLNVLKGKNEASDHAHAKIDSIYVDNRIKCERSMKT